MSSEGRVREGAKQNISSYNWLTVSYPLGRKYIAYINKAEPIPIEIYHKFSKEIPEGHAAIIGGLREQYYFENSTYQLTLTD